MRMEAWQRIKHPLDEFRNLITAEIVFVPEIQKHRQDRLMMKKVRPVQGPYLKNFHLGLRADLASSAATPACLIRRA